MVRTLLMMIDCKNEGGIDIVMSDAVALPDTILPSNSDRVSKGIGHIKSLIPSNLGEKSTRGRNGDHTQNAQTCLSAFSGSDTFCFSSSCSTVNALDVVDVVEESEGDSLRGRRFFAVAGPVCRRRKYVCRRHIITNTPTTLAMPKAIAYAICAPYGPIFSYSVC